MTTMYFALFTGFLGGLHCIGMCSPLLVSLPFKNWKGILVYHLGRILVYACLGMAFGVFGQLAYLGGLQQWLSIFLGILMLWLAFFPNTFSKIKKDWGKILTKSRQFLMFFLKKNIYVHWFVLGIFNGFLPCGLVYVAGIGATVMGSWWEGALYMLLFGVGTLPITLLSTFFFGWLTQHTQQNILKVIPFLVLVSAILLILRGLNLGIPYISPLVVQGVVNCKH